MSNDWREQGQEKYLDGKEFKRQQYTKYNSNWDHDHCEFCGAKFCENIQDQDCLHEGYASLDKYRWICFDCFKDFKVKYNLIEII